MFKAVLIDDERLPLEALRQLLQEQNEYIEVIGEYQNPRNALELIQHNAPDIIFLDIHMPEINGVEFANRIQEMNANIDIVFVTGYDRYAIEAFELFALDYILKPIQPKRLQKTLERLKSRYQPPKKLKTDNKHMFLTCFHEIKFYNEKREEIPIKWRTRKTLELFAYLLHHRNKFVAKETLIELLWPDFSLEKGYQQLYTTIYHCRNSLKKANIQDITIKSVTNMDTGYTLESGDSLVLDTAVWDKELAKISSIHRANLHKFKHLFQQYNGDYLGSYYFYWATDEVENRRQQWLQIARMLANYYLKEKEYAEAISVYNTVQDTCPDMEDSYFELMKIHASMQQYTEVENQYQKLKRMLKTELDIKPNPEVSTWYNRWNKNVVKYIK